MMNEDHSYSNEMERTRLYWNAWRILARHNRNLSDDDRRALIGIKHSFFRNEKFDPLIANYVEQMSDSMLRVRPYGY